MSIRQLKTREDAEEYFKERQLVKKWRDAISHCKAKTGTDKMWDAQLDEENRMAFERCLTQDYLLKYGLNYFGDRDFLYIDLFGQKDVDALNR